MHYKLHFANELQEAILYDSQSTENVSGIFNPEKTKIIVFSASYDKMVNVCQDCSVPWRFIRRNITVPIMETIPSMVYYVQLWGFYGDLILAKFDNVQMSLFPDMPGFELRR